MKDLETWIYVLVVKSFVRVNGVEYARALEGSDIKLFGTYDDACWEKATLQEGFYKLGYHIVGSDYEASDPSLCFWTRFEKSDGVAHVLAIYKKVVTGNLLQFRHR